MEAELSRISGLAQKDKVSLVPPARPTLHPSSLSHQPVCSNSSIYFARGALSQSQAYSQLLSRTLQEAAAAGSATQCQQLDTFLSTVVAADFPQIVARQVLQDYAHQVVDIQDRDARKQVLNTSLRVLQPRVNSFETEASPSLSLSFLC